MATVQAETLAALPDDVLAAMLGRLPARSFAVSRCVCEAWRAVVDEHQLLLPHILPHAVAGLFVNYVGHHRPHFLARPAEATAGPRSDGEFDFVELSKILDHCNGLVLYNSDDNYLCSDVDINTVNMSQGEYVSRLSGLVQ
ncbi:hypothetical protein ACP70R_008066 [Stipagrostis hirtigluma subsp. patula]